MQKQKSTTKVIQGHVVKGNLKRLLDQVNRAFKKKLAIGESRHMGKKTGEAALKVYSWGTYWLYRRLFSYFVVWVYDTLILVENVRIQNIYEMRPYITRYLDYLVNSEYSAWTVTNARCALNKLYGIKSGTKDFFKCPPRLRKNIKNNRTPPKCPPPQPVVDFFEHSGLRIHEAMYLRGSEIMTRSEIAAIIQHPDTAPKHWPQKALAALPEVNLYNEDLFILILRGKGGRSRIAPIIGKTDYFLQLRESAKHNDNNKVWERLPSNAHSHYYRSIYANRLYSQYAKPVSAFPLQSVNRRGNVIRAGVYYFCDTGKRIGFDKSALLRTSKALGHNRLSVFPCSYYRSALLPSNLISAT